MDGQEMLAYEIGKMREANFLRDAGQRHLADSFGTAEPRPNRLRRLAPLLLGIAGAFAWLIVR
jgi:hypothetical protein